MKERELIYWALSMWHNHISTGDQTLTRADWLNMGLAMDALPVLTEDQEATLKSIADLRNKVTNGDSI